MSKVDKAEQRAFEAYPVLMCYNDFQMVEEDINKPLREIYQGGYHQAEKDLELSSEDIKLIIDIVDSENLKPRLFDEIDYQEVLKRFKERKGE